jgi:hypothetical protein
VKKIDPFAKNNKDDSEAALLGDTSREKMEEISKAIQKVK